MRKTGSQLDREIAERLGSRRGHAAVATAAPYVSAIEHAIYRSKDPDALIAAVKDAQKHAAAMKRVGSGYVDASGQYDPSMYALANLLVKAKEMVRRLKIQRKTGRVSKPSRATAWKLR
jgi:hypothetical protein